MILDYQYNKYKRLLSISYVKENGMKDIMNFNVDRFKTFYSASGGKYVNWNGETCNVKWTDSPDKFDLKTYMEEMNPEYKARLQGKVSPKLYTWDIEVVSDDEFPHPEIAKYPIVTISVCSPDCNVMILGTRDLGNGGDEYLSNNFSDYVSKLDYFKKTGLKAPTIKYVKFNSERDMLNYFLTNIVAKVPVLAGWNSMLFDWQYVQNRIKGYYPDINLNICSCNRTLDYKNYTDMMGNKVKLAIPAHTVMLDMMDVIDTFDYVIMPVKESLALDYIAYESLGVKKIEYDGTLTDLYYENYQKYVYYNAIDSVLVQLIDKRFKTLQNIYTQALYCREKIGLAFSKIAISEALVFNYFYDNGIKVIPDRKHDVERGTLVGAYVRTPTPGKHNYVCCNDFASLYPSTIITCNLSFENFVGEFYDMNALIPYLSDRKQYIVVGGNVHKNNGTLDKPKLGELICRCLDEATLDTYRVNPKYFVSVNGHVYNNDKDYAFKVIQATLKSNRNKFKYLAKQLYAIVMTDVEHVLHDTEVKPQRYADNLVEAIKNMGYDISGTMGIFKLAEENKLKEFAAKLATEIEFYTSYEQAMKLLGNSMYGGSSHISFFWFNMSLANDITGEARNVIKLMEEHIPEYIREEWPYMTDVHKSLGITVDPDKAKALLQSTGQKSYIDVIYGDTDSVASNSLVNIKLPDNTTKTITIEELYNNYGTSNAGSTLAGHESVQTNVKILNWDENNHLHYGNPRRVIRHKVTKPKWRLKTKSGKEIFVTNDHSMIVFRDGQKLEVKPKDILPTDKILIVDTYEYIFDKIEICECIGSFEDEYVYDIEMIDETHTFIANDILVHNSLYISYENFVKTFDGWEQMTPEERGRIVVEFNTKYLDAHNREVMDAHYKSRFVDSVQNFELETLALSGVWLDVKKRYAQVLLWKDGKTYSIEEGLPMKSKGLELIKASYPKQTREGLQRLTRYLLEDDGDSKYLLHRLNAKMQEEKRLYYAADIDDICASMKINGYKQYMICDNSPFGLQVKAKCPANVRAAGNYNRLRQIHKLPGDPIYGGKVKYYVYMPEGSTKAKDLEYFAYQAQNYPKWADQYAPPAKGAMFQKFTMDPFNRIIEAIGIGTLNLDGSVQMSMGLF